MAGRAVVYWLGLASIVCAVVLFGPRYVALHTLSLTIDGVHDDQSSSWATTEPRTIIRHHYPGGDDASSPPLWLLLPSYLDPYSAMLERSDLVQLRHCKLEPIDWNNFMAWSEPMIAKVFRDNSYRTMLSSSDEDALVLSQNIEQELRLELLQIFATHSGLCNFDKFRFDIKRTNNVTTTSMQRAGATLRRVAHSPSVHAPPPRPPPPSGQARIAFVIIAFQDSQQLSRLIDAIVLPHHVVVVHLELGTPQSFVREVSQIVAQHPDNVVLVQFGTIVYKSDSVSHINLQIMEWLTNELQIHFDYLSLLDGASFPLHGAVELARHLYASSGNVWLGEMTHGGQRVTQSQIGYVLRKRLYITAASSMTKVSIRGGSLFDQSTLPTWLDEALRYKSNSGNQGIYSYSTVKRLLSNARVKMLFSLSQHGCCCCIEERSWIASMHLLGLVEESLRRYSIYQLWGGTHSCKGTIKNSQLDMNPVLCYRSENVATADNLTFSGDLLFDSLVKAKRDNGFLFARKFHSENPGSMELLQKIVRELHQ